MCSIRLDGPRKRRFFVRGTSLIRVRLGWAVPDPVAVAPKLREAARSSEKLRETSRSCIAHIPAKLREDPRSFEKLREAPRAHTGNPRGCPSRSLSTPLACAGVCVAQSRSRRRRRNDSDIRASDGQGCWQGRWVALTRAPRPAPPDEIGAPRPAPPSAPGLAWASGEFDPRVELGNDSECLVPYFQHLQHRPQQKAHCHWTLTESALSLEMARDFFNKICLIILERVGRFVFGYIYSLLRENV